MAVALPYDSVTPESIKAELLQDLSNKGVSIDIREGSYTNTLVSSSAYQLFKVYQLIPEILTAIFPDDLAGEYIDKNAAQIGLSRAEGQKATVEIFFAGTTGTVVPAGTALYASQSGLMFVTTEDATLVNERAFARAEAAEVGANYNLPADSIDSMHVNIAGINHVSNFSAAMGGINTESDAEFFARYHARRALPMTSGNKSHYIDWASEVPGVAYAGCVPLWDGPGTVKVIIAGSDRSPVDEKIQSDCKDHIEESRPIGVDVTVVSVTQREIPLSASVTLVDGFTLSQVSSQLKAAAEALLDNLAFGETVTIPFSRFLACLLQCPGVADYSAFTVDGGTSALTIRADESPKVGSVSVR